MRKTLYITDLDGTLLGHDARLSNYTRDTLNTLINRGMLFSFATARSIISASKCVAGLHLQGPVILGNGTFVSDYPTGQVHQFAGLTEESKTALLTLMEREQAPVMIFALIDGRERVSWLQERENGGIKRYLQDRVGDIRLRPVQTFAELAEGQVTQITMMDEEAKSRHMQQLCAEVDGIESSLMTDTYYPQDWTLMIARAGVSKATGIALLRQMLPVENVVAFGDNLNDLPLFQAADESYAVANAAEELKQYATGVIAANDEDGVAKWLLAHARF